MQKLIVLTVILSTLFLASCGTGKEDMQQSNNTGQESTNEVLNAEGIYTGQVDRHTIEVKIADEAKSFYTSPSVSEKLVDLQEGSKVVIEYYENETGRNEIKEITAID